jgi:hypothetical protein
MEIYRLPGLPKGCYGVLGPSMVARLVLVIYGPIVALGGQTIA